jgi:hypothetical protein
VTNRHHMPARSEIGDDTPLRLAVAAALAFPDGSMTASGLRAEHRRGRLVMMRIAGKDYTTLAAIAEMRVLCRVQVKDPDCGSSPKSATRAGSSSGTHHGLSETDRTKSALAALEMTARGLSGRLESTSRRSTKSRGNAAVIPLRS